MITSIQTVAVVGAGYMGGGIAQSLAAAGLHVTLADVSAEATEKALERLLREAAEFEGQGLFPKGSTEAIRTNLHTAPSIEEAVRTVDFIEEAVFEVPAIKHEVLRRISAAARTDAIIGTNTSTLPVHTLAPAVSNPERFLTVHFSNPAPFIPGVELVAGTATDPAIVAPVKEMLRRANRLGAEVADTPGFVLNRLQYVLLKEANSIVEEGIASARDVDVIVRSTFGFRLPFFGRWPLRDRRHGRARRLRELLQDLRGRLRRPPQDAPELLRSLVDSGKHGVTERRGLLRHVRRGHGGPPRRLPQQGLREVAAEHLVHAKGIETPLRLIVQRLPVAGGAQLLPPGQQARQLKSSARRRSTRGDGKGLCSLTPPNAGRLDPRSRWGPGAQRLRVGFGAKPRSYPFADAIAS